MSNVGFTSKNIMCRVLVVDDDHDSLSEYVELINGLCYEAIGVSNVQLALDALSDDYTIGILVTDLRMPGIDGFTLLEEIHNRYTNQRPIVSLVISGYISLENAVRVMRSGAMDFIEKPICGNDLAASLRRASLRWAKLAYRSNAMSGALALYEHDAASELTSTNETDAGTAKFVRSLIISRRRRGDHFKHEIFSDPAWDILLFLTAAHMEGAPVPVSSACEAANAPLSTALRYVERLVIAGMVRRWRDPDDKRRSLLELEHNTLESMLEYITVLRRKLATDEN